MKTFIIAECGINHNGDINIAKQLIKEAKDAGCNAVKFQKRNIDKVYSQEELDKYRESPWGLTNRQQKQGLEFGKIEYDEIDRYCHEIGIEWFASAWDLDSVEFLKQYNNKYNKIASAMLTHLDLLIAIAKQQKLTFIATGMSTLDEIDQAVTIFQNHQCPFILLHCNSQYPCPEDRANLKCIELLKCEFECEVGYSSHCVGIIDCVVAVSLGATVIEKHITLNRAMYGSDQASSVEPGGIKRMIEYIDTVEKVLGKRSKIITPEEENCKKKLRRIKDY